MLDGQKPTVNCLFSKLGLDGRDGPGPSCQIHKLICDFARFRLETLVPVLAQVTTEPRLSRFEDGEQEMTIEIRTLFVFAAALAALPALAVPPPPPRSAELLDIATTACPLELSGSTQPYSPAIYHFNGNAEDILLLVNANPNLNLNFTLGIVGEAPLITGAGFGADVRVRLPRTGTYQLEVSSFDPIQFQALAASFELRLALRGDKVPDGC